MKVLERIFFDRFAEEFLESKYRNLLKYLRLVSCLFFLSCMLLYFIVSGVAILRYLTLETFLLNAIYFTLSFLCYFFKSLKPVCYILFEIIWALNCVVTLAYWSYLSDYSYEASEVMGSIIPHSTPFFMTLLDFFLNQVKFYRVHYIFPGLFLFFYSVCVLMPYTLAVGTVYPGITFDSWFTYVFLAGFTLFGLVSLEIGKIIKEKCFCFKVNNEDKDRSISLSLNK